MQKAIDMLTTSIENYKDWRITNWLRYTNKISDVLYQPTMVRMFDKRKSRVGSLIVYVLWKPYCFCFHE